MQQHGSNKVRIVGWMLAMACILGLGWFKWAQREADRRRKLEWEQRFATFHAEAQKANKELNGWLNKLMNAPDARDQVVAAIKESGAEAVWKENKRGERVEWESPHGISMHVSLAGQDMYGYGMSYGYSRLLELMPEPAPVSPFHWTEGLRLYITWAAWFPWLVLIAIAVFSRRLRLAASEGALMLAMLSGVAWAVSPQYSITVGGVFSNDSLFFGLVMYVVSIWWLGCALAALPAAGEFPLRGQFRLRTLLALTCAVAVLSAMGAFGFFCMIMLALGAVELALVYTLARAMRSPGRRPVDAAPTFPSE